MDLMPEPGALIEAFSPLSDRSFRMVQSRQLKATHCRGEPASKGVWKDYSGRRAGTSRRAGSTRRRWLAGRRRVT